MKKRIAILAAVFAFASLGMGAGHRTNQTLRQTSLSNVPAATKYRLTAWGELGMHCMDGKDYSIFAVLPPFNTIHAQLMTFTEPPQIITTGVNITYEATADPTGSINTISSTKTNFWSYVDQLLLTNPPPDVGITGNYVQSKTPRPLTFNSTLGYWEVTGVPTVPYDDAGNLNPYSLAKIVARDLNGNVLATAKIVVPVSDEMSCRTCHASNSDKYAKPNNGWVNNSDQGKDTKLNILRKHDDRFDISGYLNQLAQKGYYYQNTLEGTANAGMPVLCDSCHASTALGEGGLPGINPLTQDMHSLHGPQIYLKTGQTLDQATSDKNSCYLCHPGAKTECKRGAMRLRQCMDCHGNLSLVGTAGRPGWLSEPACQNCHQNGVRYTKAFDKPGHWRDSSDQTFATNPDVPAKGFDLYRFSMGHGTLYCSTCHGSQHAEFPTVKQNDNLYSIALQGYKGQLRECTVCHSTIPVTQTDGPHGLHTVGQKWVSVHGNFAQGHQKECQYCHGTDYRGTAMTKLLTGKTFNAGDYGKKNFPKGHAMNCYDCHNGPNPG